MNVQGDRRRTAFVTGSTGFLGVNLIALLDQLGWDVVALHRPRSDLSLLQRFSVRRVTGQIEDIDSVRNAMPEDVDAVFHLAADVSFWSRHRVRQTRTNVEGTRNVVEAALQRRAKKFLHASSTAVYGFPTGPFDESAPHLGRNSWFHYMHTKAVAEEEVRKGIDRGLNATLINPANIVGPYDLHNWSRLFRLALAGRLPRVPPGRASFCHVAEVARAAVTAVDRGQTGANYILGGADATYREAFAIVGELVGRATPSRVMRPVVLRCVGNVMGWVSHLTRREPFLTPEAAAFLCADLVCRSDRAVRELDYRPQPLRTMLEDCYRWMKTEGVLAA